MADLKRDRQTNVGPSMTSPLGVADETSRAAHEDAQAAIEDLNRRMRNLSSQASTEVTPYDDAALRREIADLWDFSRKLENRVEDLERRFPIFRHARVKDVFNDYLECVFYNPANDTEGGTVLVAKPWSLRVTALDGETVDIGGGNSYTYAYISMYERTRMDQDGAEATEIITPPYFLNEQLLIAKTSPFVLDGGGQPIAWEDLNSSGRGWQTDTFNWIEAETFGDLPADAADGSWGRTQNIQAGDGILCKAVKNGDVWIALTAMV